MGLATPRSFAIPISLTGAMSLSLEYSTTVTYGPTHSGVRVSFDVTSNSHPWDVAIYENGGGPLASLSSSSTGTFTTAWLFAPNGVYIQIHSSSSMPSSMNLDGTLTITSSRFPFI